MALLSLEELSQELSIPLELIQDLIHREIITPYGGRARLGEPRFSRRSLAYIREQIDHFHTRG